MEKRYRMSIEDIDALHMNGEVRYMSHREHAKFFAVVDGEGIYHLGRDGYFHLGTSLESWCDWGL